MRYLFLFVAQMVGYVILVVNLRALNRGKYLLTAITEFVYAVIAFTVIRKVVEASTWLDILTYAAGATTGSLIAMWITKHWDTKGV